MRKDVKFVVAAACLLLIGLLAYVLFSPAKPTAPEADATEELSSPEGDPTETQAPLPPPPSVAIDAVPATQPSVTDTAVTLAGPTTAPSVSVGPVVGDTSATSVVPAAPTTEAVTTATPAATDWDRTLTTGALSSGAAQTSGASTGFPPAGAAPAPLGASTTAGDTFVSRPTSPTAPAPATGSRTHKVQFGETLSSIASEHYGNAGYYTRIAAANPGINPNRLRPGTVLTIPDLKAAAPAAATSSFSIEVAGADHPASGNTYTVRSGDSLQKIASRLYGSTDKWQKIYDLNRAAIGSDPHRLKAGTILKLPDAPASATATTVH